MQISGKTNKQFTVRNYVQFCLNSKWVDYIHKLEKYQDKGVIDDAITDEKNVELYNVLCEKHSVGIFTLRPNPVGDKIKKGACVGGFSPTQAPLPYAGNYYSMECGPAQPEPGPGGAAQATIFMGASAG